MMGFNYESPIFVTEILNDIVSNQVDNVYQTVCKWGMSINKEEMVKALAYDRDQYAKGYKDGVTDLVGKYVWHNLREDPSDLPPECKDVLIEIDGGMLIVAFYISPSRFVRRTPENKYFFGMDDIVEFEDVVAWRKLPLAYSKIYAVDDSENIIHNDI